MKSNVERSSLIPVAFTMVLLLLLSVLAGAVIMAGGNLYEKIAHVMDKNYEKRVSLSYVITKIRQNDVSGHINVENHSGIDMLAITEVLGGWDCVTYLYYYDGYIREIFLLVDEEENVDFNLSDGDPIILTDGFDFKKEQNFIELTTENEGTNQTVKVALRSR